MGKLDICEANKMSAQIANTNMPIVYLVDGDDYFRNEMVQGLFSLGLIVRGFDNAASLYRAYATRPANVVVLDVGLEGENGLSIATHLRASQAVKIVMATPYGATDDLISSIQAVADAYLVKPIDVRALSATINALNDRNARPQMPAMSAASSWNLVEGGWVIMDDNKNRLRLTTSERQLLERLLADQGTIVARQALVEALGEDIYEFNYAHLDTIVSRLRRRAQKVGISLPLHAIRGRGFTFAG